MLSKNLFNLGQLEERAPGVFQFTLRWTEAEISVQDFLEQGLVLPEHLQKAIAKRQLDYLAGRYCVQQTYAAFDLGALPLPTQGPDRAPIWPEGWCGSITHTRGVASAVLSRTSRVRHLGLDIEHSIGQKSSGISTQICSHPSEWPDLNQRLGCPDELGLTLIFSAKESLFKALYPSVQSYFGFSAAYVTGQGPGKLNVALLNPVGPYRKGQSWDLHFRSLGTSIWETLLLDPMPL